MKRKEVHMARKNDHDKKIQSFSFTAPTAMSVQLVGDFTHWQQNPINMRKGGDGIWRAAIELEPGPHHYRFLVDGQWQDDPDCILRVPNPYGSEDSVRQVA
jgi:1,4-alpha-glucan branching enzyme